MSDTERAAMRAMFARISESRPKNPISAFAGGSDNTTILSCCAYMLVVMIPKVAATQVRLVNKDLAAVFQPPRESELPEKYSLVRHNQFAMHHGAYYNGLFASAPVEFVIAFNYKWSFRSITKTLSWTQQDCFFINCATFRSILKTIHKKLSEPDSFLPSRFSVHDAQEIHHLVNVMSCPTRELHPHWREILDEAMARAGVIRRKMDAQDFWGE
jgi:hypothetical protein